MKILIIVALTLCAFAQPKPVVVVERVEVSKLSTVTGMPAPGATDHIKFSVFPTRHDVTSVRLAVEIQDDGELIKYEKSYDAKGGKAVTFAVNVSAAGRAVIIHREVTQRIDLDTTVDEGVK